MLGQSLFRVIWSRRGVGAQYRGALLANETMVGRDDLTVIALPHDKLLAVLADYNRLVAE